VTTVSVVIPTWNRSTALERAIQSVLSQTYAPLEVLICDDGSTDDTEQIVKSINDSRVIWLAGEHSGRPSVPRNRGICNSIGEWVAFLDDDDTWMPEKLAEQVELVKKLTCHASCTQAFGTDGVNGVDIYNLGWFGQRLQFRDLLQGNRVICSSALIHRSVFSRVGVIPEAISLTSMEDYAFWLRVATVTDFAFVSEPLVTYTDSPLTSLRSVCTDAWRQNRVVYGSFLAWGCKKRIGSSYLKAAFYKYAEVLLLQFKKRLAGRRERKPEIKTV